MDQHKEIQTLEDVLELLEDKTKEFQDYLLSIERDTKDPNEAYIIGQHNGLMFAQVLLTQLQKNRGRL